MTTAEATTDRTRLRRRAERGRHDLETINAILDEALVCHVGFAVDGRPWVMPMAFARIGDGLYLHGAVGNFALRTISSGIEACVTVTLLDGLVLARSAFHHSMNYRTAMIFGQGTAVRDETEKLAAVMAVVEHLLPGRSADTRAPTASELRETLVVRIPITEASAKVRTGGPVEEPADFVLAHWAGVLPLALTPGTPVPDVGGEGAVADRPVPDYLRTWPDCT